MRTRFATGLFCLLLLASVVRANFVVPQQKIVGSELPIPLGELADLSISSIEKKPEYLTAVSYNWRVYDFDKNGRWVEKRVRAYKDESREGIFFGSGLVAKRVRVFCLVTYLFVVKDTTGKTTDIATRTVFLSEEVQLGDEAPPIPPGPTPPGPTPPGPTPPDPAPVFPDGKFKLAKRAYDLALAKVPAGEARAKGAAALATAMKGVASAIAAGTIVDLKVGLSRSSEMNQAALVSAGVGREVWEGVFKDIQETLFGLYQSKEMDTALLLGAALTELAMGLEKVK